MRILQFAHDVADLSGPEPEGLAPHPLVWIGGDNPHAGVGLSHAFGRDVSNETAAIGLSVQAAPGHPVCHSCEVPVEAALRGRGACATRCPRCGDQATYEVPHAALALSPALVAAVADLHRTDRPQARTTTGQTGILALSCPSCGGNLRPAAAGAPGADSRLYACAYCNATCVVPHHAAARARDARPEPDVWWLLMRGPSSLRASLQAPIALSDDAKAAMAPPPFPVLPWQRRTRQVGDPPGVYSLPDKSGPNVPQIALNLLTAGVALALSAVLFFAGRALGLI